MLAEKILSLTQEADITAVMGAVEELLDRSIATEGYVIQRDPHDPFGADLIDLSRIDFDALRAHFRRSRKRIEVEKLRAALTRKLNSLVLMNRTKMDYLERFQRMIDEYNSGSKNVESLFEELVDFAQALNEEEKRGIAQQLSEEELAVFDLLTKPEMSLTKRETEQVKKVARELLATLKREKLVLDWRMRQQSRAAVRLTIEETLDRLPEKYAPKLFETKCAMIYQHVYDSYFGSGRSIYVA